VQITERRKSDLRDADLHGGATDRVELPCHQLCDDTGLELDMCDLSARALLCQDTPHLPTVKRMPAIMHDDILPDMGRMNPRLLSEEKTGCSQAATPEVSARLRSTR